MALTYSPPVVLGAQAPDFRLPATDGKAYRLGDFSTSKAVVVAFICNHCPYVIAVQGRINALAREYAPRGVVLLAINSNDAERYPDDGFEEMKKRTREERYVFPYLRDDSQDVARAYGAVCTPDLFVLKPEDGRFLLKYRGRIDDSWKDEAAVTRRDLAAALDALLAGQDPSNDQAPSMGCSIKWRLPSISSS